METNENLNDEDAVPDWIQRHPNVTDVCILLDMNNVNWMEW